MADRLYRPSATPFDYLAEALPGQLAPELSPTDRAEFTGYCKQKLPGGGEALPNVIAALIPAHQTSVDAHILLVAGSPGSEGNHPVLARLNA